MACRAGHDYPVAAANLGQTWDLLGKVLRGVDTGGDKKWAPTRRWLAWENELVRGQSRRAWGSEAGGSRPVGARSVRKRDISLAGGNSCWGRRLPKGRSAPAAFLWLTAGLLPNDPVPGQMKGISGERIAVCRNFFGSCRCGTSEGD